MLKELLGDAVKKREILFVMNILSFLKDGKIFHDFFIFLIGNSKCLSEEDSRSWAQELLQSVGRSTDLISTIMGSKPSSADGVKKSAAVTESEIDFDTWRSILVHLRANYPIGMAGASAHVKYVDESDPLQTGVLKRVQIMKTDLEEIIQLKEEKIQASRSGKILESTLALKDSINMKTDDFDQDSDHHTEETGRQVFNLYADNIFNQIGKHKGGGPIIEGANEDKDDTAEENLADYDNISLIKDPKSKESLLLSLQQSLVDTLSSSGKTIEYDDGFVMDGKK
jgi:hypothetical protein